ncbi:unnamed protein product [Arabis nemorensis]|uniref:RING-type domain-containing protein n=1 Tax=Arabis nemorensis TaxID=586526 RepID=A0A565CVP4_9BRAS|nr:unnamed protein product [Arabis nemorensis]
MISDSITNASATAAPTSRDYGKKKRNNKSAKMKQNKLGLRREQWLSQVAVTNKVCKEERNGNRSEKPDLRDNPVENLDGVRREEDSNVRHESFMQSPSNSSMGDAKQDSCLRASNRAWRPDDDLRPQGLPNLGKQLSFPELDKRFSSVAIPSSCPICYEDLDLTDSSFLPCPCRFRLCLFCHKTICEGDGRCPGCRKPYDRDAIKAETSIQGGGLTIRLARSSSMFCRF